VAFFSLAVTVPFMALATSTSAAPAATAPPNASTAPAARQAAPAPTRPAPAPNGLAGPAAGTGGAPAPKLPAARPVDDILRDMVKALGGAEAIGRHKSMHTKMNITFQGLGITGTAEHYGAVGDRALTITNIPNLASTREGTDGKKAWSQDPINGLRLLEDLEAEQARVEAAWNAELRMKELFPTIEAKNEPGEGGAPYLECLVLTPKAGAAMTECFDPRTHLMVRQRGSRSSPQGTTPFVARMRDWRAVGDVKMPFVTEMQVGPLSFVGTITSAELDVPIDASLFALPEVAAAGSAGAGGSPGETGGSLDGKTAPRPDSKTGGQGPTRKTTPSPARSTGKPATVPR